MQSSSRGGEGAGKSLARSSGKALASSTAPCTVGSVQVIAADHLWHGWGKKERRGGGVLCSGTTIPGTVQEKPCSASALSSVICYQRASAQQDQQRASTNNPVYSNVTSMVRTLRSFHLMSCPMTCCFSGTICHPEKEHLSGGCLLPTLPGKQGRISNKGVCPGWRMPARDGVLSQQTQAVPLGRSGVSCLFSVGIAAGLHLPVGPPPRSAAMT